MSIFARPPPRSFSNKENTPSVQVDLSSSQPFHPTTLTSASKPRVYGKGRAPKTRSLVNRHHSISHKPKTRSASVQRAKVMANKVGPVSKKGSKAAKVAASLDLSGDVNMDDDAEIGHSVVLPGPSTRQQVGRVPYFKAINLPYLAFPYQLPRPVIPPVTHAKDNESKVPIEFVLKHLTHHLPLIYNVTQLYSLSHEWMFPAPVRVNTPTYDFQSGNSGPRLDDLYDRLPFWIEESVAHGGLNEKTMMDCQTRGPTAALLVRGLGDFVSEGEFHPVNKIVLDSQCSFLQHRVIEGLTMRAKGTANQEKMTRVRRIARGVRQAKTASSTLSTKPTRVPLQPSKALPSPAASASSSTSSRSSRATSPGTSSTSYGSRASEDIKENVQVTEISPAFATDPELKDQSSHAYFENAKPSSTPPQPRVNANRAYGVKNLPVLPLYVPDVSTFGDVIWHLHCPAVSVMPLLLQLDAGADLTSSTAMQALAFLPLDQLSLRVDYILRFYDNLVYLGIGSDSTWQQFHQSWAVLCATMMKRGARIDQTRRTLLIPRMVQHAQVVTVPAGAPPPHGTWWFHPKVATMSGWSVSA